MHDNDRELQPLDIKIFKNFASGVYLLLCLFLFLNVKMTDSIHSLVLHLGGFAPSFRFQVICILVDVTGAHKAVSGQWLHWQFWTSSSFNLGAIKDRESLVSCVMENR